MQIIDCNVVVGRPIAPGAKYVADPKELLAAMDAGGVDRALVWHVAQHDTFPQFGNDLASEFTADQERLMCSWSALPPVTNEIPLDTLLADMAKSGVFALRLFPTHHRYQSNSVTLGKLLEVSVDAKVPLIFSIANEMPWPQIHALLGECPNLTCILTDIGVWSQDRNSWPLLENYPGVHIETSLLSVDAGGLASAVKKFGAERFVYGSGYPDRYFEAPLLDLLHSDITDSDKELIASGNMLRLKSEVRL